ncbi:MAG: YycH family regulatory protein [Tepidibacillus sp.]
MKERIKSIILFVLVANSLFLTWFLIFYSPNNEKESPSEYVPRLTFGQELDVKQMIRPKQIIYHLGENSHSLSNTDSEDFKQLEADFDHWSFYEITSISEPIDWTKMIEVEQGIEIVFPFSLPNSVLSSLYKISTTMYLDQINRLWLVLDQNEKVIVYFISDQKDKVYQAETSISSKKLSQYIASGVNQPRYSYYWAFNKERNINTKPIFYLPNEGLEMKKVRKFITPVSIEDYIQLLFIDPSMVRKVYELGNKESVLYTDGSRSMQFFPNKRVFSYFQPVTDNRKQLDWNNDLAASIRFVNQHGGWVGQYQLDDLGFAEATSQPYFTFQQYVGGYPLLTNKYLIGEINIQLVDGIVSKVEQSMTLLDQDLDTKYIKTSSGPELLKKLEQHKIDAKVITSIELGYQVEKKNDVLELFPHWRVRYNQNDEITIPAYEGGM